MKTKVDHTTIRNQNLFCLNCGGEHKLQYPVPVSAMNKKIEAFNALHADCPKTWSEKEADQTKSIQEKAMFWMANGERGMSSETMWNCFMGNIKFRINHPHDPDDFSRCYKLLKHVPEWKNKMYRLKPLSKAWSNLVDNWDKLTEMYEQNVREEWKNSKKIGMYDLMQKLTTP